MPDQRNGSKAPELLIRRWITPELFHEFLEAISLVGAM